MARQVILKTVIELDGGDRALFMKTIGAEVKKIFQQIIVHIDAGLVHDVGLEAHDAAAWTSILSHIGSGHYKNLEDVVEAVNCLDTMARDPWWPVIDQIRNQALKGS